MSRIAAKQVKLTNPAPVGSGAILYTEGAGIAANAGLVFDDTSGAPRVGIGTAAAPSALLHLQGDNQEEGKLIIEQNHSTNSDGPDLTFYRSRGTPASPSTLLDGDAVGGMGASRWSGSTYSAVGAMRWRYKDANTSYFEITTSVSNTLATRLEITTTGALKVSGAYTLPTGAGNDGQILTSDGAGGVAWEDSAGGGVSWTYERKSADFTAVAGYHYSIDTTAGAVTVTLPASSTAAQAIRFKRRAGNNSVTINRAGADTIDGETSYTMNNQHQSLELVDSGLGDWEIF
jgi:hypothetical protein